MQNFNLVRISENLPQLWSNFIPKLNSINNKIPMPGTYLHQTSDPLIRSNLMSFEIYRKLILCFQMLYHLFQTREIINKKEWRVF